jgi:hypothetical protein
MATRTTLATLPEFKTQAFKTAYDGVAAAAWPDTSSFPHATDSEDQWRSRRSEKPTPSIQEFLKRLATAFCGAATWEAEANDKAMFFEYCMAR